MSDVIDCIGHELSSNASAIRNTIFSYRRIGEILIMRLKWKRTRFQSDPCNKTEQKVYSKATHVNIDCLRPKLIIGCEVIPKIGR